MAGRLPPHPRVAVVGARACDAYGREVARQLGSDLARAGVAVVSGGAAGVDAEALDACLRADGAPVAVLGTGVDVAYPAANRDLFGRIAARGALVSEHAPGTPGRRAHFPRRNRLVSGLSDAVVVVRAARGSGSLITADHARRQGRPLLAVPGPVGDPLSAGVHQLLRAGAALVEDAADVLDAMQLKPAERGQARLSLAPRPVAAPADLSAEARLLLDGLSLEARPIDGLVRSTGLDAAQVSALLLELELRGLVIQQPGMAYARAVDRGQG